MEPGVRQVKPASRFLPTHARKPINPQKGACVLLAMPPPKNGGSTAAKSLSAHSFVFAEPLPRFRMLSN
jgi:hypothetical protein